MKKCPNCQKTFDDDKRFCQVDGTPLIDEVELPQVEDPYKTVVVGKQDIPLGNIADDAMKTTIMSADSKDDDILQIPEVFDPMKTMVVSEPIKFDKPVEPPKIDEPSISTPELPKFNEPNLTPPNFGEFSANEPPKAAPPKFEAPKFDPPKPESPISSPFNEPPKFDKPIANPFSEPPKVESPFSAPKIEPPKPFEAPKFDAPSLPETNSPVKSPFELPKNDPFSSPMKANEPPPFKVPESNSPPPSPFSPTPFGQNEPFGGQPLEKAEWKPPTPPAQDFGGQSSFQPTSAAPAKQNNTLGMVSLILGVVSFVCGLSFLAAIPAIITGYMQKGKIKSDPVQFGGGGLATAGMILGVANVILSIIFIVLYVLLLASIVQF
jgi:hypothetical protein